MAKMNYSRERGGDDDYGAVGAEPTNPAKYSGTCSSCGQRFTAGDPIAPVIVDKRTTYLHGHCRYPATAMLERTITGTDVDAVAAADEALKAGRCRATTNKGKPCGNAPQKGEQFCGPHLTQLVNRTTPLTVPDLL